MKVDSGLQLIPAHPETWLSTATDRGGPCIPDPRREAGRCPQCRVTWHFPPSPESPGWDRIFTGSGECAKRGLGGFFMFNSQLSVWCLIVRSLQRASFPQDAVWVPKVSSNLWTSSDTDSYLTSVLDTAGRFGNRPYLPLRGMLAANTRSCSSSAALLLQTLAISQTEDSRSKKASHALDPDCDRLMVLKAQSTGFKA